MAKYCDAEVTIGGATYRCGRTPGHVDDAMDPDAEFHQCEGHEHPLDGQVYRMTWTTPRLVVHYTAEPEPER